MLYGKSALVVFVYNFCRHRHKSLENTASRLPYILSYRYRKFSGAPCLNRKVRLKIEFSRGSSRLSTKTSLFSMISVEGDFVRTCCTGEGEFGIKRGNIGVLAGFGLFLAGIESVSTRLIWSVIARTLPTRRRKFKFRLELGWRWRRSRRMRDASRLEIRAD